MKRLLRASLAVALLASGRSAVASPVPSIAYQNCWIDYWDTYDLWCGVWVKSADGSGHMLEENGTEPAWSPDGSKIAFGRFNPAGGIAVLDVVNGTLTEITTGIGRGPAWSPDGTKIAFRGSSGTGDILVANADGSGIVPLTTSGDVEGRPAWSPDGTKIAFGCLAASGNREICTVNADGTGTVQLTDDAASDADPAYSPDGTLIAFTSGGIPGGYTRVMASDGTGLHSTNAGYWPAWSPDATRIASTYPFSGACPADGSLCYDTLAVVNADGTGDVTHLGTGSHPSWTAAAQLVRPVARFSSYCDRNANCQFWGDGWDMDGTVVSQTWDFGDGATGSGAIATHTYASIGTYTVTFTVIDDDGLTTTRTGTVVIPPRLTAAFTFACAGRTCSFDGRGSSSPNGTIVSYYWEFGDGATGQGPIASHTYANGGVYQVYLIVSDDQGDQAGLSHYVTVSAPAPPVAAFTASCTENQCAFNGLGSSDPDGTIAGYAWTFGDGATGSGATPSHTYTAAGTFSVALTVTDNSGLQGTVTHPVTVTLPRSHVGDLDGTATGVSSTWTASVNVVVHATGESILANATVTGTWSLGGSSSCTTNALGECAVSKASIPNKTHGVTFTITGMTHATRVYAPAANHDPDGDSNGTAITVTR